MLKNIEKLKGVKTIAQSEQLKVNGGMNACFFISCRPGTVCVDGRCVDC